MDESILTDLKSAYGSLRNPRWHFVRKRFDKQPYQETNFRLVRQYTVTDTTDLNTDTSLCLTVCELNLTIRLSLVGRYACVHDDTGAFLSKVELASLDPELSAIIDESDIQYLDAEVLIQTVVFGEEETTLFKLLFSDDEFPLAYWGERNGNRT